MTQNHEWMLNLKEHKEQVISIVAQIKLSSYYQTVLIRLHRQSQSEIERTDIRGTTIEHRCKWGGYQQAIQEMMDNIIKTSNELKGMQERK